MRIITTPKEIDMYHKTKSIISFVLTIFAIIQATIGWMQLIEDWAAYVKRRGY